MQKGHLLEQIIAEFSSLFFMNDFVILNPKYYRAGHEKELADLLLVLDDTCIVISVKGTDGEPKSETRLKNWLEKKTLEGLKQAKGGINWLSKVSFSGKDLWGETKEFQPNGLRATCGVVLLECCQQPYGSIEYDAPQVLSEVPLHFLSVNDFMNVVRWLGSIFDVFEYFSERVKIRHTITGINQEQPVFAYHRLCPHDLTGILFANETRLEELSAFLRLHLFENQLKYEEREKMAAYVNAIVHELHTRHPLTEDFMPVELKAHLEPSEKRTAHLKMASMLNALPMSHKVWIGRKLQDLLADLKDSGKAGCFAHKHVHSPLVFLFACFSKTPRTQRIGHIHSMLPAALYQSKVTDGLAIALDAENSSTGFDLVWMQGYRSFDESDRRLAEFLFPISSGPLIADLFGKAKPYQRG
jgi:hypothetical protein